MISLDKINPAEIHVNNNRFASPHFNVLTGRPRLCNIGKQWQKETVLVYDLVCMPE
jgi:hypothetical protein